MKTGVGGAHTGGHSAIGWKRGSGGAHETPSLLKPPPCVFILAHRKYVVF